MDNSILQRRVLFVIVFLLSVTAIILIILIASTLLNRGLNTSTPQKEAQVVKDQCPIKISPCPAPEIVQADPRQSHSFKTQIPSINMLKYQNIPNNTIIIALQDGYLMATKGSELGRINLMLTNKLNTNSYNISYSFIGTPSAELGNIPSGTFIKVRKGTYIGTLLSNENHNLVITFYNSDKNMRDQFALPTLNPDNTFKIN